MLPPKNTFVVNKRSTGASRMASNTQPSPDKQQNVPADASDITSVENSGNGCVGCGKSIQKCNCRAPTEVVAIENGNLNGVGK